MSIFYLSLAGIEDDDRLLKSETWESARDEAIQYLGEYLMHHPKFARDGHWRVDVKNDSGQEILHIIVATVMKSGAQFDPPPERAIYA